MILAYFLFQLYTYIVVGRITERHGYEKAEARKMFILATIPGINACLVVAYLLQL